MRVDESNLNQSMSPAASRSSESQRIQVASGASSGSTDAAGSDRVDLSGLAGRITAHMQALSTQAAQRVQRLQSDVRAGSYQPDAQQLSRALMGS